MLGTRNYLIYKSFRKQGLEAPVDHMKEDKTSRPVFRKHIQHEKFMREVKRRESKAKSQMKAKMLRKYSKLCVTEGIQSDRVHMGSKADKDDKSDSSFRKKTAQKPFPFEKEMKQAESKKQEKEMMKKRQEERELAIRTAETERKRKRGELQQKNNRGQPVLRNKIKHMLSKLQGGAPNHS